ncbi:alpha/beta hydrolase [candidate division KSB1 bacterium]
MKPITKIIILLLTLFSSATLLLAQEDNSSVPIGEYRRLHSRVLNEDRIILIHLPRGYEESQDRYPVLYCLDGDDLSLAFSSATVRILSRRKIPDMIVVAISNTDRSRDMFPVKLRGRPTTGGADNFLSFIIDELFPFIDKNYRTENFRILYGASAAGLFTVYALLSKPESFSGYISSSPMIGRCPEFISEKANNLFRSRKSLRKILYMTYGRGDAPPVTEFVPPFVKTIEAVKPGDFIWELRIIEDDGHIPYTSLYDGLGFIFSDEVTLYNKRK